VTTYPLEKFLRRFFQKATAHPRARSPWSRPQARNLFNAVFLVLFLRLLAQKKNGENYLNVTVSRGEM
jgi:hypothetical protein